MAKEFQIDSLSYTNKDFNSIYEELLDMGDAFSAKWKPSATNESDPGIILLKENAVIGDKLNFNIDKNILEAFPSSVTQEGIARQLFEEQLACPPSWYVAASGTINMRYLDDGLVDTTGNLQKSTATLPNWVTVQDSDSSVTYTIVTYSPTFYFNGDYSQNGYRVLQGTPNNYTFGTSEIITYGNLDAKRRLYFQEYNVAENGIFISNIDDTRTNDDVYWRKYTLLSTLKYGEVGYKFGVDKNNRCYIEFPEWASDIIKNGIRITYITTNGLDGNIAPNVLEKFSMDVTVQPMLNNAPLDNVESITLNSENTIIQNIYAITNGKNPDTIEEMYHKYEKTMGTFNTLLTIRDYNNALEKSESIGNGFMCDRTNDLQTAFSIIETEGGYTKRVKHFDYGAEDIYKVDPYDLKMYLIQTSGIVQTAEAYKKSFNFVDNFGEATLDDGEQFNEAIDKKTVGDVIDEFQENKCISQDFATLGRYRPLYFKNYYPVNCTIVPVSRVSEREAIEIKNNIVMALYDKYNGSKMEFGKEIDYDDLYNTILTADKRISSVRLQDITYKTYAVYRGSMVEYSRTPGVDDDYIEVPVNNVFQLTDATNWEQDKQGIVVAMREGDDNDWVDLSTDDVISEFYNVNEYINIDNETGLDKYYGLTYDSLDAPYSSSVAAINKYNGIISMASMGKRFDYYPFGTEFATDIYAKSVLNGNTPLIEKDQEFNKNIGQNQLNTLDAYYITTNSEITLNASDLRYKVQANENIQVFTPNYSTVVTYAFGSKMQYCINNQIPANTDYRLGNDEWILVFWSAGDESQSYQWRYYGEGDIIRVSKTLSANNNAVDWMTTEINMSSGQSTGPKLTTVLGVSQSRNSGIISSEDELPHDENSYPVIRFNASTVYNKDGANDLTTIYQMLKKVMIYSQDSCMANDSIQEKKQIKVELGNEYSYFWILNKFEVDPTSSTGYSCVLFDEEGESYTLNNGEYFFYSNPDGTALYQLGAGTKITRDTDVWSSEWKCDMIDIIDYFNQTAAQRNSYWQSMPIGTKIVAYEQTITSFGEGTELTFNFPGSPMSTIDNQLRPIDGGTVITYKLPDEPSQETYTLPAGGETNNQIRSALLLNCSSDTPQKLIYDEDVMGANAKCVQSITAYTDPSMSSPTNIDGSGDCEQYILSNRPCEVEGECANVQNIDYLQNTIPLKIYNYNNITQEQTYGLVDDKVRNNEFGGISFSIDSNEVGTIGTSAGGFVDIKEGMYLLPVKYISDTDDTISIGVSYEAPAGDTPEYAPAEDILGSVATIDSSDVWHYIALNVTNQGKLSIQFDNSGNSDTAIIQTGALIPYTMTKELSDENGNPAPEWYVIRKRIKDLDGKEFDFGYEITQDDLIENPLDANSFNNPNHIANPFTICEMDIDAMGKGFETIRILNTTR